MTTRDQKKTRDRWIIFSVIAAVGLVIAIVAIANTTASPRSYIASNYNCDHDPGEWESVSCTTSKTPSDVATDISRDTSPIDRRLASDGTRFLQYGDDIVAISAMAAGGSLILLDDYDTGYNRHSSYFAVFGWTSTSPGSRGGGFGSGK